MIHNETTNRISTRWWLTLSAVICTGFVVWTFAELRAATNSKWGDADGYLTHAIYILEHGGILGFLKECYAGVFPIVERHALYMLLLQPFTERTLEFFLHAKLFNLVNGLALLASLMWMVARRYGRGPAVLAGILYGVSQTLVIGSANANHDPLIALCTLWAWWHVTGGSGRREPQAGSPLFEPNAPSEAPEALRHWAIAGIWLGLGYLTKSSAILIIAAIVAAGLWRERIRFLTSPRIWVLLIVAAVVSSPLLVRNVRAYGTPIYEGVNSYITWMDDWRQLGDSNTIIVTDNYGAVYIEKNGLPTASQYFATHDLGDVVARLRKGITDQVTRVMPLTLAPAFDAPSKEYRSIWGRIIKAWSLAAFALAIAGWWLRRRSWEGTLLFFGTGAFLTFFGWNVLFPEYRYWAPLIPIWIGLASYAAWTLATRWLEPLRTWRLQAGGVVAIIVALCAWTVASGALTQPRPTVDASPAYLRLVDWMNANLKDGDRVLPGPVREFWGLSWMIEPRALFLLAPNVSSIPELDSWVAERRPRYLLVTPELLTGSPPALQTALSDYLAIQPDGALLEKKVLPGWRPIYRDRGEPSRFFVYERLDPAADQ